MPRSVDWCPHLSDHSSSALSDSAENGFLPRLPGLWAETLVVVTPAPRHLLRLSVSWQVAQNRSQRPQEECHLDPGL